jgi:hypothetical protein
VTDTAVAVNFYKTLDVESNVTAKVTFYYVVVLDLVTELSNLIFSEVLSTGVGIDAGLCKDVICTLAADTVDVGKSNLNTLGIRNINTSYTSHSVNPFFLLNSRLTLTLLMLGVLADDHYTAVSFDDLALFADLLYGRLNFHFLSIPF